jgi:intein-encoded DNA endonuclease-like protein
MLGRFSRAPNLKFWVLVRFGDMCSIKDRVNDKEEFRYTLDGDAREWIEDWYIASKHSIDDLKIEFLKKFSLQGNSKRQLKRNWIAQQFDPTKITISKFN